jgi:hypothetical protein
MIPDSGVTWVHVEKPVFDLAGVLVSSLSMAGLCALLAAVLGAGLGLLLIRRRRRLADSELELTLRVTPS